MILEICLRLRKQYGIEEVALSGGVFFNRLLLEETIPLLEQDGFTVYTNHCVPAGDGGLSLGQAYIGLLTKSR
jgi:hydrogenase maturation protein HypF